MREYKTDVIVLGGGPAGMAAALEITKHDVSALLVERAIEIGGILNQCVHTGFGIKYFSEELSGPEFAQLLKNKLNENASRIKILPDTMVFRLRKENGMFLLNASRTGELLRIVGKSLLLATGARERTRHMVMIPGFRGAGIYTAGLAQRLANIEGILPGRKIVILGSGDVGLIMARRLTLEGAEVVALVEVMPYINGSMRNYHTCVKDFNIPTYLSHTITFIHGKHRVTGVTIAQVDEKWNPIRGTEKYLECDTVLLSVGLIPENEIAKQIGVEIDPITGGPIVDEWRHTSVDGVFAGGNNVQIHDLADEAAKEGEMAGRSAALYVKGELKRPEKYHRVIAGNGVRYVVPQRVSHSTSDKVDIDFYFRVVCPMEKVTARILSGEDTLVKKPLPKARPGEMIILKCAKAIKNDVKVEVSQI